MGADGVQIPKCPGPDPVLSLGSREGETAVPYRGSVKGALLLALALTAALPLAGCTKIEPPPGDEDAAGSGGAGGAAGGAGAGVTAGPGQDPGLGKELGEWGPWQGNWAAGQHYKYTVTVVTDGASSPGWYELTLGDAGDGRLRVDYSGSLGLPFGGSFIADDPRSINWSKGIDDVMAWAVLASLMVTPSLTLGSAQHGWEVGQAWSWGEGENKLSFAITGKRSFAGITGALGEWKDAAGGSSLYCVNPNVPLALYLKLITDDRNYMEYVLAECGGF